MKQLVRIGTVVALVLALPAVSVAKGPNARPLKGKFQSLSLVTAQDPGNDQATSDR